MCRCGHDDLFGTILPWSRETHHHYCRGRHAHHEEIELLSIYHFLDCGSGSPKSLDWSLATSTESQRLVLSLLVGIDWYVASSDLDSNLVPNQNP